MTIENLNRRLNPKYIRFKITVSICAIILHFEIGEREWKGFKICLHSALSIWKFRKFLFTVDILSAMGAVNQTTGMSVKAHLPKDILLMH